MDKPFFYDITLRDGNQSLKKPWQLPEKQFIFEKLKELNVQAVEVGFPASSHMDFECCKTLADMADDNLVVSALARTVQKDIDSAVDSIGHAKIPRVHTFLTLSPFHMKYVLNKEPSYCANKAIEAVEYAYSKVKKVNKNAQVQFSVEHFGDCAENLDFVIDTLKKIVHAGASVINLPNTVERTRPKTFIDMIVKVKEALGDNVIISLHNHNDLGMATATTVEGYFAGAIQLECCLNGLGERAGNTDFAQVAVALHNNGVEVPVNLDKIYETSMIISQMSNVAIYEKAPLVGPEALAHRSGIHQDGAIKTKDMEFGAYRPINPSLIGRDNDEKIGFTSQSGKTAIYEIINSAGYPITIEEAVELTPVVKEVSERKGELKVEEILEIYSREILDIKGAFELVSFKHVSDDKFCLDFKFKNELKEAHGCGNGPLDACLDALKNAGFPRKLSHYKQYALDEDKMGSGATAMSVIKLVGKNGEEIIGRATDKNTAKANVKAIFNALNRIYK